MQIQQEIGSSEKRLERLERDDDQFLEEMKNKKQLNEDLKKANQSK